MKEMKTWKGANGSAFQYEGSVQDGTTIMYGTDFAYSAKVSAKEYGEILVEFAGKTVSMGTSRDKAPGGSVGAWCQKRGILTAIASYVGPILVSEGYATKAKDKITFK